MKPQRNLMVLLFSLWLLAGCVSVDGTPFAELAPPPPIAEIAPRVEFPLLPMSDGDALSALEVFAKISPAVAYVETPRGTGSGILIEPGYLVSNAHVVWPYNSVRVVFPDGTEYEDVEVIGWDLMADLSLLRLPNIEELDATPVTFVDGSGLTVGSDVYLIGYPGEVESFPQPTISQGILARERTWEATGMEVFQVDADITGGQSGGVMVTERGEVIGITTFDFTSATYAMVPSAAYAVPRLSALANDPAAGFSDRRPLGLDAKTEHFGRLDTPFDSDAYIIEAETGEDVQIAVEGVGQPYLMASGLHADWTATQSEEYGENIQRISFTIEKDASPYFVWVRQPSSYRNKYTLISSHPLALFEDADDLSRLRVGEVFSGALDLPTDIDLVEVDLQEGEKVALEVDSLVFPPLISMIYESPTRIEFLQSYDGGATSVFGENARLVFEAPQEDTYTFIIESTTGEDVGGYFVTVSPADADEAPTRALESRTLMLSNYGPMYTYESDRYGFTLQIPGAWREDPACPPEMTACFGSQDAAITITEEDLTQYDLEPEDMTQEGYTDLIEQLVLANLQGGEIVSREPLTTPQGFVGTKLIISAQAGLVMASRFLYVNEDSVAFSAAYFAAAQTYADLEDVFDYSYTTFRQWDDDSAENDLIYFMDEAHQSIGEKEYDAALHWLNQILEADPKVAKAYAMRGDVYHLLQEYDLALADYEQARVLDPNDEGYIQQLALIYWDKGDLETALMVANEALELYPENEELYNNRALMRATAGDYEGALDDIEQIVELSDDDELAPHYLDSRGYIYLKMEEYANARKDYDEALAQDFQSPYVLLGAGIAYERLSRMTDALPLLEYGLELLEKMDSDATSPQLADLLEMAQEILDAQ